MKVEPGSRHVVSTRVHAVCRAGTRGARPWRARTHGVLLVPMLLVMAASLATAAEKYKSVPIVFQSVVDLGSKLPAGIQAIAVLDFGSSTTSQLGNQVGGLILSKLSESGKFTLVERERIRKVLNEMNITVGPESLESDKIKHIGAVVGADAVIFGDIPTQTRDVVVINFRMIDVKSGSIILAVTEKGVSDVRSGRGSITVERRIADMAGKCVESFVARVAPCSATEKRNLLQTKKEQDGTPAQLGIVHAQNGLWTDATNYFADALQARPSDAASMNNLAVALEAVGDMGAATRCYDRAYSMATNAVMMENFMAHKKLRKVFDRGSTGSPESAPAAAAP